MAGAQAFKSCLAPLMMNPPHGPSISVPCGKCRLCLRNRRNDLAGRAIIESHGAAFVAMVTLTYRNDPDGSLPPGASDFVTDHLSLFIRAERKKGKIPPCGLRYLATGERGPNGTKRCHYHVLMIFKDGRPAHWPAVSSGRDRVHLPTWRHGHLTILESDDHQRLARYVAYYAYKTGPSSFEETDNGPRRLFAGPFFSRNPVLGHDFAVSVAREYAEKGLCPHDASYSLKGQWSKSVTGRFYFRGTLRDVFVTEYVDAWRRLNGSDPLPSEFVMEKFYDPISRREMASDAIASLDAEILSRPRPSASSVQFDLDEEDASAFSPDVSDLAITRCRVAGVQALLTARSDKTAILEVPGVSAPFLLSSDPDAPARQQLLAAGVGFGDARALGRWLNKHWWASERPSDLAERKAAAARVSPRRSIKSSRPWSDDCFSGGAFS